MGDSKYSVSRRGFLDAAAGTAALTTVGVAASPARSALLPGKPLRVKPVLAWALNVKRELTSWRGYGGLTTRAEVDQEARGIEAECRKLVEAAEFPIEMLPLAMVNSTGEAAAAADTDADVLLVYASAGPTKWFETLAASGKPNVMFIRQNSGPFYLYYEIADFRFLRKSEEAPREANMDADDVVVDDYGDVLWRLRALYGLKNARGTRSLAIGGLRSYSVPGQKLGPAHVRDAWGYGLVTVSDDEVGRRIAAARADAGAMQQAEKQAAELLAQPNVTLGTERRFVVNSFLALKVFKDLMKENDCTNVGVANCMGSIIRVLDTPPCLIFSLLNDEGYTAFCHTDYTHTPPGVLLRWISGKPSFISNSHFPHHGSLTLAHCATPRRMNGRDMEPSKIVTHFESDYGAATRVEFTKGTVITNLIPNLTCTKWQGFRATIVDTPNYPACRSQINMTIDGNWKKLLYGIEGFHTVTCYGDYLKEVGYALKRTGVKWENLSES
ncbi:MAG: sugar isomerase [Bryobacteraceae bacterium]